MKSRTSLAMLFSIACAMLISTAFAQTDPVGKDVPREAKEEALRRGAMVQEVGTAQASGVDIIADALSHPPDDSHKWYFNLIYIDGCEPCDKLKSDIIKSELLRAWINVDDQSKSAMHYQVRRANPEDIATGPQKDWFAGIKPELKNFPVIVIQPPRNGEYGKNSNVVCVLHGYTTPEDLVNRIRKAIGTYVTELKKNNSIEHVGGNTERAAIIADATRYVGGHAQEIGAPIGGQPQTLPFSIPTQPQNPAQPNVDWPTPLAPQPVSLDTIKALIPNAPPEFLLAVLQARLTDPAQVLQQWQLFQARTPETNPTQPTVNPNVSPNIGGWLQVIMTLFGVGGIGSIIVLLLTLFRSLNKNRLLTDEQFKNLTNWLAALDSKIPPPVSR